MLALKNIPFYLLLHILLRVMIMFSSNFKFFKANVVPCRASKIILGRSTYLQLCREDLELPYLPWTHYFLTLIFLADSVKSPSYNPCINISFLNIDILSKYRIVSSQDGRLVSVFIRISRHRIPCSGKSISIIWNYYLS